METNIDTDERALFKATCQAYKTRIKAEAIEIRTAKKTLRESQKAGEDCSSRMSAMHSGRCLNRARQIAYGLHRGKTIMQMEGREETPPMLKWYFAKVKTQTEADASELLSPKKEVVA